jgi:uncharacterized membrane protein YhaH (DUF805 family)
MSTRGRLSRGAFLTRFALPIIALEALSLAFDRTLVEGPWGSVSLSFATAVVLAWPAAVGIVRRLHDLGHRGWLLPFLTGGTGVGMPIMVAAAPEIGPSVVVLAVPVLTIMLGLLWFGVRVAFVRGTRGPNRYGPDPLATSRELVDLAA